MSTAVCTSLLKHALHSKLYNTPMKVIILHTLIRKKNNITLLNTIPQLPRAQKQFRLCSGLPREKRNSFYKSRLTWYKYRQENLEIKASRCCRVWGIQSRCVLVIIFTVQQHDSQENIAVSLAFKTGHKHCTSKGSTRFHMAQH